MYKFGTCNSISTSHGTSTLKQSGKAVVNYSVRSLTSLNSVPAKMDKNKSLLLFSMQCDNAPKNFIDKVQLSKPKRSFHDLLLDVQLGRALCTIIPFSILDYSLAIPKAAKQQRAKRALVVLLEDPLYESHHGCVVK